MGALGASSFNLEKAIQTLLIVFISYPFGKLIVSSKIYESLKNYFTFSISNSPLTNLMRANYAP